ncbi:50S ribosomal protein L17 [bioreactor metagenome]|uniref:50S ribosomal protein L17 n=1 Tax=bioreactor metagenome TaxID=1076179 RepID=A0A644YCD3_9ZZZZ
MLNIDKYKVKIEDLKPKDVLNDIEFNTTKDISPTKDIIGQDRAVQAIKFGLKMNQKGYNIYVAGTSGVGRTSYTHALIKNHAKENPNKNLKDWVYVNNFKNSNEPTALCFDAGQGKVFKKDIEDIIDKLKDEIPKIFNSKEYEYHSRLLMSELESNVQKIIEELNEFAKPKGFKFQVTERGLMSIPIKEDGTLMQEDELGSLTAVDVNKLREDGIKLNQESKDYIDKIKSCEDIYKNKTLELDKNVGRSLVGFYGQYLLNKYGNDEKAQKYINEICNDVVDNISKFKSTGEENQQNPMALLGIMPHKNDEKLFNKYKVNLFIDNSECNDCKIIIENNPTYYNLTGSIDYKNEIGALTTSFMEIKPGALHKANGGYLIINTKDLLSNPFSWDCLKRSLKTNKIAIESLNKQLGYLVTSTLKPEPIDLDVKVILVGDGYYYSLLYAYEEDFRNLFKIMADFDIEINKNKENIYKTVQLIANKCNEENLKQFDKSAVERLIEYSMRLSDNKDKLTAKFNKIVDIIYEAQAVSPNNHEYITKEDVVKKLFDEIAPKYKERNGGYTRIAKVAPRRGDAAEVVVLELV